MKAKTEADVRKASDQAAVDPAAGESAVRDQRMGLLNAVYDRSGGDTHHAVYPSTLAVPGMLGQDILELVGRLVAEKLLERPHGDRQEVYLTPEAVKLLAASEPG